MVPFSRQGIVRRTQGFLPADAVISHVVCGQAFAPWWQMIPILRDFYVWPWHGFRIIAITHDAMYLLSATHWWHWKPKELLETLPRAFEFTPHIGTAFTCVELGGQRIWIPLTFKSDMWAADADLRAGVAGGTTAPAHPTDPLRTSAVRWTPTHDCPRRYCADVDGASWALEVDQSNQGIRYIIKKDDRYVSEVDQLPKDWVLLDPR